jgi:S1-C subfamily serine protease
MLIALSWWWTASCFGQPALDQLEKDLRGLVGNGAQPAPEGGAAAGQKPAAAEPGYLGVIADDRQDVGAGVRILDLLPGGPADKAGLRAGDLVVGVGDKPVRSMDDFGKQMTGAAPGTKLKFSVQREGQSQTVEVTLGRRPPPEERPLGNFGRIPEPPDAVAQSPLARSLLGLRVVPVTDDVRLAMQLPQTRGALVVEVASGSVAQKANVPVQAVIVAVDAQRVDTPDDLSRLVNKAGPGATIKLAYYSQGKLFERKITLDAAAAPRAEAMPPGSGPAPFSAGRISDDASRVELLERRVQELEQRITELERLLRTGGARKGAVELPKPGPAVP